MCHSNCGPLRALCCASVFLSVCPEDSHGAATGLASGGMVALMRHSDDMMSVRCGLSRADLGCAATVPPIAEIAWQLAPATGGDAGHVPSAGPLVLLGIATLVGSAPARVRHSQGASPDRREAGARTSPDQS